MIDIPHQLTKGSSWETPVKFNKLPTNKLLCTSFVHSRRELKSAKMWLRKNFISTSKRCLSSVYKRKIWDLWAFIYFLVIIFSFHANFEKYYEKKKNWKTEANSLEQHRLPLETNVILSFRDPVFSGSVRFTQHDSRGKRNSFPPDMLHTLVRLITRGTYIYGVNMSWQTCLSRWGKVSSLLRRLRIPSFE